MTRHIPMAFCCLLIAFFSTMTVLSSTGVITLDTMRGGLGVGVGALVIFIAMIIFQTRRMSRQ